jgi:hypothetical protein
VIETPARHSARIPFTAVAVAVIPLLSTTADSLLSCTQCNAGRTHPAMSSPRHSGAPLAHLTRLAMRREPIKKRNPDQRPDVELD